MTESTLNPLSSLSILVCTAVRGGFSPSYTQSIDRLAAWCRSQGMAFDKRSVSDAPIDAARDMLAAAFLTAVTPDDRPFSHCLMIDAGVGFSPETIEKLLLAQEPFTAVAVPLRRTEGTTFAVKLTKTARETGRTTVTTKNGGGRFMEVDGVGGALLCLKAKVFERIFVEFPELQYRDGFSYFLPELMTADGVSRSRAGDLPADAFERTGEDIAFCNRWRQLDTPANPAKIWLLTDAQIVHEGNGFFHGNFADQLM